MVNAASGRPFDEARLRIPARSDRFVRRPRVTGLLDAATRHPVTVVTGPAGTGKTLAVADWTRDGAVLGPVAWVSLGRSDAALGAFWRSLVAACEYAASTHSTDLPPAPDAPDPAHLGAIADALGGSLVVVLDDVHELDGGETLGWLDSALRWTPTGVRIVFVSRHDPAIALQRLRLEGRLAEVRFADLAFTSDEALDLLGQWDIVLTPAALERLMETTGGWVAAVRLAALSLTATDDPSATIERLGSPTVHISEYLWDEVLRLLPDHVGEFLVRISIVNRVNAALATELTGEPHADAMLRGLAHDELLVQELDATGWYRSHSLMTEVMHARLKAERPLLERELQRTASAWFEAHADWTEAMRHALATGDWEFAGGVVARCSAAVIFDDDRGHFARLMAPVPVTAAEHPEMAAAFAVAAFCRHDDYSTRALVARALDAVGSLPEPRRSVTELMVRSVQASQAHRDGDGSTVAEASARAVALQQGLRSTDAPGWAHYPGAPVAMQAVGELWLGRPDRALDLLLRAVEAAAPDRYSAYSLIYFKGLLALAQAGMGSLREARASALRALDAARTAGRPVAYETQWAWLALANVEVVAGDDVAAAQAVAGCERAVAMRANPFVATLLRLLGARRSFAASDTSSARRRLAEVEDALAMLPGIPAIALRATDVRVGLELASGSPDRAAEALVRHDESTVDSLGTLLACRAEVLLATGHADEVRSAAEPLLERRGLDGVRGWICVALAEDRLRRDSQAIAALATALDLAEREGAVLPLLRPQPALASALRRHRRLVGTHIDLIDRVLGSAPDAADAAAHRGRPLERLTERELAVLLYVPTMGSNADIADALSISENTVKQHLKSIYRKLGVGSRREAVRVAREVGIVPWQTVEAAPLSVSGSPATS